MTFASTRRSVMLAMAALPAAALLGSMPVAAKSKPTVFTDFPSRLALDGYDAVAYFEAGKPIKGSSQHAVSWNGATWHFSSAGNKTAFEADPEKFAPQYGGHCAWAVSEGYTAKGDPNTWRIVDGRLYLNYNASVQKSWERDIPRRIAKADGNWPKVIGK